MKKKLWTFLWITIGVLLISVAYYFFLEPSKLVTGGVTGLMIMLEPFLPFPPSILMYILNISLLLIGLFLLGKDFFFKTCYASVLSPTFILILEKICEPDIILKGVNPNNWYFISMLVSSVLMAAGLGICFRVNATTGGMDIFQKIMTKYLHIPYSKTMYLTDWVIILISGFFIRPNNSIYGIEGVVYGLICVYLLGYIVDYIALNAKSRRTAYIITSRPEEMKKMIFDLIERGVTECDVRGGYTGNKLVMLICTLDNNETYILKDKIHEIDKDAFTFMSQTKEVIGYYD